MMRSTLIAAIPVVSAISLKAAPAGLGDMIAQLESMKNNVQTLHNDDADMYEEVACHCDSQNEQLTKTDIPDESKRINEAAATIEEKTALKKQEETDLARNQDFLAETEKMESEQAAAWTKRDAELRAAIAESTQAANALGAAKPLLSAHPEILQMVEQMESEVSATLLEYNTAKQDESDERDQQNKTNTDNINNATDDISKGKTAIADHKSSIAQAKGDMLAGEEELTKFSDQLKELTKYCETQAADWDETSASRSKDFSVLSIAVNVLSCGKEECGSTGVAAPTSFLQTALKKQMRLGQTENAKRAAVRSLVRLGEKVGDQGLLQLKSLLKSTLGKDPLLKVKKLIRQLITKLMEEQAEDQAGMNECTLQLQKCKSKRDFSLEDAAKLKLEAEALGIAVEEDKSEFFEQQKTYQEQHNVAQTFVQEAIPTRISTYDKTKENLETEKMWISKAIGILQAHFGVSDNELQAEEKSVAIPGAPENDRTVGNKGETQSTGAKVVLMFKDFLADRKAQLKTLREEHVAALKEERTLQADAASTAAGAKARAQELFDRIAKNEAKFTATVESLQAETDIAASNGRCVQELEPCGVQTDRRAKREAEMAALKDAWAVLNNDTEGLPVDEKPLTWA
jgi:hypothetical protein